MKKILFSILSLITISAFAQQEIPRWKYTGIVQSGLIGGSSELNYAVQTIQGVQKGPWLVGIGAGIDNYVMPGFPVVAHGQFSYGKRRSKPFLYAQAGPHIPWSKNDWDDKIGEVNQYELKTGWVAEGGIGYSFPMGRRFKLLSSIGYSTKQVQYDEVQMPWSWWLSSSRWPPSGGLMEPLNYYHQKLTMNRLILKVGVQF
jgi:hypothetical protein